MGIISHNYLTIDNQGYVCLFRPVASEGPGGHMPPHFLADQLTLSQPGRAHYPHQVLRATPDFQTLQRPCYYTSHYDFILTQTKKIIQIRKNSQISKVKIFGQKVPLCTRDHP